jgi:hypothetical protein
VPIVFATRYSNQSGAKQRCKSEEDAREVSARAVDMALSRNPQRNVSQSTERETAMSARKTAPSIMEYVVVRFGADFKCHELVRRRAGRGFASRNQVWTRSPDCVFDDVGYEECEQHANEPAEEGDVGFVCAGAHQDSPKDEGSEGDGAGVDEEPYCVSRVSLVWVWGKGSGRRTNRHAFDLGVGVGEREIVEGKHAVEGFGVELDLRLVGQLRS